MNFKQVHDNHLNNKLYNCVIVGPLLIERFITEGFKLKKGSPSALAAVCRSQDRAADLWDRPERYYVLQPASVRPHTKYTWDNIHICACLILQGRFLCAAYAGGHSQSVPGFAPKITRPPLNNVPFGGEHSPKLYTTFSKYASCYTITDQTSAGAFLAT